MPDNETEQAEKEVTITLKESELQVIFDALVDRPFKEVFAVISSIQEQLEAAESPQKD